tara:strand:+ start:24613 stop:25860 length:1248 start_codon:yes stop_codon:yes gene_type:complete
MLTKNNVLFYLGIAAAIPFFFIPSFPFIYINLIWNDPLAMNYPPYPGYTSSLGMAAPLIVVSVFLSVVFLKFNKKSFFDNQHKDFSVGLLLLISFSLLNLYLSNSIKVLGAIASFGGFLGICYLFDSKGWKKFSHGFLYGILSFCVLHASSILINGIDFSIKSEGISIFGFEIYQALVSYSALMSFMLGTLIVNHRILNFLPNLKNNIVRARFYYIVLFSSLVIILAASSRRLSFVVCLLACMFLLIKIVLSANFQAKGKVMALLAASLIGLYFSFSGVFVGIKSIDYEHMIKPRLNAYLEKIDYLLSVDAISLILGSRNGWAQIENGILDIILATGLVGLIAFFAIFYYSTNLLFKIAFNPLDLNRDTILYIIFSALVLLLNTTVNHAITTPYFFVCFIIIFIISIKSLAIEPE